MASNIPPPPATFDSANRDKTPRAYDVMRAGPGNAWEDRGSRGVLAAFFVTCFASLFRISRVCDEIRRPETTSDATTFAIGCGIFWSIGWAVNAALGYHHRSHTERDFDLQSTAYIVGTVLQFIIFPMVIYAFVKVGSVIFYKLIAGEMEHKFNQSLAYNVLAYCMGPSILAVIPIVGMPLALLWCAFAMIAAAKSRLYLRGKTAVICSLITFLAGVIAIALGYFVALLIWTKVVINLYVIPQGS